MKTNLLFVASLLLSSAVFSQENTSSKDQAATSGTQSNTVSAGTNSEASASINTTDIDKAGHRVHKAKQVVKKEVITQKKAIKDQADADLSSAHKTAQENDKTSGSVHADAGLKSESGNNKINQDASLSNQAAISGKDVKSNGKELNTKTKTVLKNQAGSTTQKAEGVITQTSKPKPATIKMKTEIKSNAGLKIK